MSSENPSILNHISIGVNDLEKAVEFYDSVMATIGAKRQHEVAGVAVAYGKYWPEFWVQKPLNGNQPTVGNGAHYAFLAPSVDAVKEFYRVAIDSGGTSDGEPGPRPEYGPSYYGCFVKDIDGHKIEATVLLTSP